MASVDGGGKRTVDGGGKRTVDGGGKRTVLDGDVEGGGGGGGGRDEGLVLNSGFKVKIKGQTWKVVRQLGKGSYGVVCAIARGLKQTAALKTAVDKGGTGFQTAWEGWVLHYIHDTAPSSFIIRWLADGIGQDERKNEFAYVALEVLHPTCPTLSALVEQSPNRKLDSGKATKIAFMMLKGLLDLHRLGLLHRDIKPDNVGILPDPNHHVCVLIDLGMARFYTDPGGNLRPPRSYPGQKGTPSFMSQKVVGWRESGRVDDLWSWFFTVVELMKGEMTMPWDELGVVEDKWETDHLRLKSREVSADIILKGLPEEFYSIRLHLSTLNYEDPPDYGWLFVQLDAVLRKYRRSYPNESLVPTH